MKREFRGELCVYCNVAPYETDDHVISREFFLVKHRANLPQVPACRRCNGEKSILEHYLTAVLGFGGLHPHAAENLNTLVKRRLEKNLKLKRELETGFAASGEQTIPVDYARVNRLFEMIAQGLAWYHWRVRLDKDHGTLASAFHDAGAAYFEQMFNTWRTPHRVSKNWGDGTFVYEAAQATDDPSSTVWRFWMYGGIIFTGDEKIPGAPASLAIVLTAKNSLIRKLRFKGAVGRRDSKKIGRNELCPCGSGKKFKRCCDGRFNSTLLTQNVVPSVYSPLAAHGYGPDQLAEMRRFLNRK